MLLPLNGRQCGATPLGSSPPPSDHRCSDYEYRFEVGELVKLATDFIWVLYRPACQMVMKSGDVFVSGEIGRTSLSSRMAKRRKTYLTYSRVYARASEKEMKKAT